MLSEVAQLTLLVAIIFPRVGSQTNINSLNNQYIPSGSMVTKPVTDGGSFEVKQVSGDVDTNTWKGKNGEEYMIDSRNDITSEVFENVNETFAANNGRNEESPMCKQFSTCKCYNNSENHLIVNCSGQGLAEVPSYIPIEAIQLLLNDNAINTIPPKIFGKLSKLSWLDLSSNFIQNLGSDAFKGLLCLKTLLLSNNFICYDYSSIHPNVFLPLSNLTYLNFQQKGLNCNDTMTQYPILALKALKGLRKLSINGLLDKPFTNEFQQLTRLTTLSFNGNVGSCKISRIVVNMLTSLSQIHHLSIVKCNLMTVEKGSFIELPNLRSLDLSQNTRLGFGPLFNITHSLQFLKDILILNVSQLHEHYGDCTKLLGSQIRPLGNSSLKQIYLDSNRIYTFEGSVFDYFPASLEKVSLRDNQIGYGNYLYNVIKGIYKDTFKNLRVLIISQQRLTHKFHLSELIKNLMPEHSRLHDTYSNGNDTHFQSLKTKRQAIIEQAAQNLNTPEKLHAHGLEKTIETSKSERLNCSECINLQQQDKINMYLPGPPGVWYVDLSENKVRKALLGVCICEPNNLRVVKLQKNMFYSWKGPFVGLSNLTFLDLSWNYCSEITSDVFQNMPSLECLNISGNYMNFVLEQDTTGQIFGKLSSLKEINLAWNKIEHLPVHVFQGLTNLESLDLSNNNMVTIDITMSHMRYLRYVNLSYNMITDISKSVRSHWDSIAENLTINLKNNTFICSCKYIDIMQWFSQTKVHFSYYEKYNCKFENGSLGNMTNAGEIYKQLSKKCASYFALILCSTLAVVLAVGVVIAGLIYRYRWNLRYMYYSAKLRFKKYNALQTEEDQFQYDAFVSYEEEEDGPFVKDQVVPELETNRGITLAIHKRDFLPGRRVFSNIANAVMSSRKTLIILSKYYQQSKWCMFELNMARIEGINSGREVLCVLIKEGVPKKHLPLEIIDIIREQTYLQYPKDSPESIVEFWDTLAAALKD